MKNIFLFLSILFSFTFLSCREEEERMPQTGENSFSLYYTIPAPGAATRSEIASLEGEDRVNTLYALFFEHTSGGSGRFITAIDLMEGQQNPLSASGILNIDYAVHRELSAETTYNVLLCANIEAYNTAIGNLADLESFCFDRTHNEVAALLQVEIEEGTELKMSNLPMSASVVKQGGQKQVSAELTRVVSRFDVSNRAGGYELVSATIWNAYPTARLWANTPMNFSDTRITHYYGVNATEGQITGGLYGFENSVENPAPGDDQTTALIIEMINRNTGAPEFFRTNIHPMNNLQQLKRNNIYQIAVTEVLGQGFTTAIEAYESNDPLLITDVNGWMADPGENVVFDNDNILAVPTSIITLAMTGDSRTYHIFTDGEGTLDMTATDVPSEVDVILDGNKLHINAPASLLSWEGILTFSIGRLTTSMLIGQAESIGHYLDLSYEVDGLPALEYTTGSSSPEIDVTASGKWIAKIYGGNYMVFDSSVSQQTAGEAGTGFTVRTTSANTTSDARYCFAVVSLADAPQVSRTIILEQATKPIEYIRFNPGTLLRFKGKRTVQLKVESNAKVWSAEIKVGISYAEDGKVTFADGSTFIPNCSGNQTITVNFPKKNNANYSIFLIEAKTADGVKASQSIYWHEDSDNVTSTPDPIPTPDPARPRLFVSNGTGIGNLVSPTSDGYKYYVYGLGQNMRNTNKFGKNGTLAKTGKEPFEYKSSLNATTVADAQVIQLMSNPSTTLFNQIYNRMQEDPTVFLMITSRDPAVINAILAQFKAKTNTKYGSAINISNSPSNIRPLNTAKSDYELIKYMSKGIANPSLIGLQSSAGQVGAALPPSAYPSTFVPIIMANRNNDYCVFGIDPTHRLIIMTDPGIFGAAPAYSAYPGSQNYVNTGSPNSTFLDNLTAWITMATAKEGFAGDYK